MTFTEYENILENYHFHSYDLGVFYSLISLSESVGDAMKKIKLTFNDDYVLTDKDKQKLLISIGDIIYWASNMAIDMGMHLDDTIELNIKKLELQKRKLLEKQLQEDIKES